MVSSAEGRTPQRTGNKKPILQEETLGLVSSNKIKKTVGEYSIWVHSRRKNYNIPRYKPDTNGRQDLQTEQAQSLQRSQTLSFGIAFQ